MWAPISLTWHCPPPLNLELCCGFLSLWIEGLRANHPTVVTDQYSPSLLPGLVVAPGIVQCYASNINQANFNYERMLQVNASFFPPQCLGRLFTASIALTQLSFCPLGVIFTHRGDINLRWRHLIWRAFSDWYENKCDNRAPESFNNSSCCGVFWPVESKKQLTCCFVNSDFLASKHLQWWLQFI